MIWKKEDKYIKSDLDLSTQGWERVESMPVAEPTTEEQVQAKELQTGLTRVIRELVLAKGSGASEYVKQQAQEIEDLAQVLRISDDINEINEAINAETVVNLTEK